MSKIRVYELAKELGLENKALLDLCLQVGVEGKKSHSNSLSDEEAERIRRYVIRRALSGKGDVVREVSRDGDLLTERRRGNVIRRRKKSDEEPEPEPVETEPHKVIDLTDIPRETEEGMPKLAPNLEEERASRQEALKRADALFGSESGELAELPSEAAPTEAVEPAQESVAAEPVEEEIVSEAPPVEEQELSDEDAEVVEGDGDRPLSELRRRHDIRAPKVLGRIDLPVAAEKEEAEGKEAKVDEKSKADGGPEFTEDESKPTKKKKKGASFSEEEDELGRKQKRPKKKQVLRKDELLDYDGERDNWKGKRDKKGKQKKTEGRSGAGSPQTTSTHASKTVIKISGEVSVGELAKNMGVKAAELIKSLMALGVMANINQVIDFDTASLLATELGFTLVNTGEGVEDFVEALTVEDDPATLVARPPVVTVMGHVDHGKTSLLDAIRKTSVTTGEHGGITQHIGAYNVVLPSGGSVTFLDTPGHEAFTAMRSRGAQVTDIVVLVVAADDGVMPQTIEAINHAKAAEVPIIVAVNKIDKEDANRERVINQLSEYELIPEDWGGDTIMVDVSAITRDGVDLLLENLVLQAEILELKANPERDAIGTVVESKLDKGRGPVVSVLVQNGTLKKGDAFVTGSVFGRIRAMNSDDGKPIESAGPSIPVEILGASEAALAGDDFYVIADESRARTIAERRGESKRSKELAAAAPGTGAMTLERFSEMVEAGEVKTLPIIVKADVQGSVEAVSEALERVSHEELQIKIIHKGVGGITENDVQLAGASGAVIVGFNVRADSRASQLIGPSGVEVLYSRVIYDLVDSVDAALRGRLAPKHEERTLGRVEVRQTFKVPKLGMVAGSYVLDGTVERGAMVRLLRDNVIVFEGRMASLRRFKEDVKSVQAGYECGIGIEGYSDIKDGDVIEVFKIEEVPR